MLRGGVTVVTRPCDRPSAPSQIPGEAPWLLLINTSIRADQRELPLGVYALETHTVDGASKQLFARYRFTIETFEMERITIDHVSSLKGTSENESARECAWWSVGCGCRAALS